MAPPYGHHNNFYDPVGSQANQPTGYTYGNSSTSTSQPASASYGASSYPSYSGHSYGSQRYAPSANTQQNATASNVGGSHVATGSVMSGVGGQDNQTSANRSGSNLQYESDMGSWGNPDFATSSYHGNLNLPGRSQSNTASPLYAPSTSSSTYTRPNYNAPSQQPQSSTTVNNQQSYAQHSGTSADVSGARRQVYGTSQHNVATTEPSRYASPLHVAQAHQQQQQQPPPRHQGHGRQASRSSNQHPSPVVNSRAPPQVDHRQSSTSVEPMANTTVDPSQVYDFRAEREKKERAEAEKRRKREEVEAAKRAEEARIAQEKRKADEVKRQAEELQAQEARRAEEAKRLAGEQAAAARVEAHRKEEEQRKVRESKSAASTLASLATSNSIPNMPESPPLNEEEAEMRAMFKKMREFNTKNPTMLAKLWEEERRSHASHSRSPQPASASQPVSTQPKPSVPQNDASSTPLSGSTTTPNQMKPFSNTPKPKAPAAKATPSAPVNRPAPDNQGTSANQGPAANANLWPPGKKGWLADVAARWLHSVNLHRAVTPKEMLDLLDRNPNYVQLCEALEANGLKFDRADFARELLRGVQPAGTNTQPSHKAGDEALMSANGTVAQASGVASPVAGQPKPKRPRATKAEMEQRRASKMAKSLDQQAAATSNNGMVDYEMPSFSTTQPSHHAGQGSQIPTVDRLASTPVQPPHAMSPLHTTMSQQASRHPSQSVQPERQSAQQSGPSPIGSTQQTPQVKHPSPPRQPANKEEAARKRGFNELVDLTAGDSDDEDMPPKKMMQPPHGLNTQRQQPYQSQPHSANNVARQTPGLPSSAPAAQSFRPPPGMPTTAQMIMMPNGSFGVAPPVGNTTPRVHTPNMTLPASNVPNSIPPTQQPPKRKGPTNEQLQAERIKGKMVVEPIMRDRVLRRSTYDSRTIARDVLLATGRHPDMRPLNGHLHVMQKLLGDRGGMADQAGNKSDLATIKWDILDPDPPKKAQPVKKPDTSSADPTSGVVRTTEAGDGDADDEGDVAQPNAVEGARHNSAQRVDLHNQAVASNNTVHIPAPKKRGRPPRASLNKDNNSTSAMSTQARNDAGDNVASRSKPKSAARATSSQTPASAAVGYAAFRQLDEAGNPIKKKGRPVGWRKSVHSREAQGLTPAKPGEYHGPKTKASIPKPKERLQEPSYQVYKCQWTGCAAELHSLEVLKKHVTKVHGREDADGSYYCSWKDCKLANKQSPASSQHQAQSAAFKSIDDWLAHIVKEHLQPVAWTLGDGPRGGLSGKLAADSGQI